MIKRKLNIKYFYCCDRIIVETFPHGGNLMKKFKNVLLVGAAAAVLGIAAVGARSAKTVLKTKADLSCQYYVPVTVDNFNSGEFNIADQISQGDHTFFNPGRFFGTPRPLINTINLNEGRTGDIRSGVFNQTGEYVSFLMGGNPNFDDGGNPRNFINVWSEDKGYNIAANIANNAFSDPNISCNMVFKYVFIPEEYRGRCLIYMHDGTSSSFGGITFGDLRINQTWDDVVEAFSAHIATYALSQTNQANIDAYNAVKYYYDNDAYYAQLRTALAAKTSADDGFEKQNGLINWGFDRVHSTYNDGVLCVPNFTDIVSDATVKQDGYFEVGMPYNKTGDRFVSADTSGIPEDAKYRIVSSEFTLSGSGFVSAKLGGGTAVLELLDANYNTLVSSATAEAVYPNALRPGFQNGSREDTFNLADTDVRLNTMSRVYIDGSEYIGQRVRIALSDARVGGEWGLAYFDEVKTYYPTTPTFRVEVASQASHFLTIPDEFVSANSNAADAAYTFWRSYLSTVRGGKLGSNYCSAITSDPIKALLNSYNELSEAAKRIVCGSDDYERVGEGTWYDINPTIYGPNHAYSIGHNLQYFAQKNNVSVVTYSNNGSIIGNNINNGSTSMIVISVTAVALIVSLVALLILKKKRKH